MTNLLPYPAYKPSDVEWLGKVPAHWDIERAKWLFQKMERPVRDEDEIVTCFRDGVVTLRKNRREAGFTESLKEIGYQGIRRGDLVIHAMDGFAGAIGVADSGGKGTPVYSVCKPQSQANAYFYAYTLREMARNRWIQALAKGIRERSSDFRYRDFALQLVPFPPLPEQTAITHFLDYTNRCIQRHIRAKQKLITLLEEQKQAITHQAVTGQIDVRTGQPYPAYKDSGVEWLGEVPEHWEVRKLRHCGTVSGGMTPSMEVRRFWGGLIPWVTPKDMKRAVISDSSVRVTDSAIQETPLRLIKPPAVLIVVRGMILARRVPIAYTAAPVTINQDMKALRTVKGVNAAFLARLLDSAQEAFMPLIDEAGHGTRRLPTERWREIVIAVPPVEEQANIVECLDNRTAAIDTTISHNQRQIDLLSEYRTRLISDVVTGKLDVREAAARLPEVDPLETEGNAEETIETTVELTEDLNTAGLIGYEIR